MHTKQSTQSEFSRLSQLIQSSTLSSAGLADEDADQPAPLPAPQPADSGSNIDSKQLTSDFAPEKIRLFQSQISTLKSKIQSLNEAANPVETLQTLATILEPFLNLLVDAPNSALFGDPESDLLEQELQLANDSKSRLDQLPEDRQEKLFDLLQNEKGAAGKLPPLLLKHWDLQTSETALRQFKKRYQAKLEAAEKARLQKELNDLSGPNAPNHTQAAEKLLERRLIQTVLDPKSTPEQIQKIVSATTRFINCQTSRGRLEFQQQKVGRGVPTAPRAHEDLTPANPSTTVQSTQTIPMETTPL